MGENGDFHSKYKWKTSENEFSEAFYKYKFLEKRMDD